MSLFWRIFLLLAAVEVVKTTTSRAAADDKFHQNDISVSVIILMCYVSEDAIQFWCVMYHAFMS